MSETDAFAWELGAAALEREHWAARDDAILEVDPRDPAALRAALAALFARSALIVRAPGFLPATVAARLAARVVGGEPLVEEGVEGPAAPAAGAPAAAQSYRRGVAFYEVQDSAAAADRYFAATDAFSEELALASAPDESPLDRLRTSLREVWPLGARRQTVGGRRLGFGIARLFTEGGHATPHQDCLERDALLAPTDGRVVTQLATNVFLSAAERGGELLVWPRHLDREAWRATLQRTSGSSNALSPAKLGPPAAILRPHTGDLVLCLSDHPHAVARVRAGRRVTLAAFVGYHGDGAPLTYWT